MKISIISFFTFFVIFNVFAEENLHYPKSIASSENLELIWQAETRGVDTRKCNMAVQIVPEESSKNGFGYFRINKDLTIAISNDASRLFMSEAGKKDPEIFFLVLLTESLRFERDNLIRKNIKPEYVEYFFKKWNLIESFLIQESQRKESGYVRIDSISIPPPEGFVMLDADYGEDISLDGNNAFRKRMQDKENLDSSLKLRKALGIYPDNKTYIFYEYGIKPYYLITDLDDIELYRIESDADMMFLNQRRNQQDRIYFTQRQNVPYMLYFNRRQSINERQFSRYKNLLLKTYNLIDDDDDFFAYSNTQTISLDDISTKYFHDDDKACLNTISLTFLLDGRVIRLSRLYFTPMNETEDVSTRRLCDLKKWRAAIIAANN